MAQTETPQFSDNYFRLLGRDWKRENPLRRLANLMNSHALRYLLVYRKLRQKKGPRFLYRFAESVLRQKYGLELDSDAIGKGLYLGHPYNISVSKFAVIGDNCNLNKGAAIGAGTRGRPEDAPTLGNKVWVGTNAVIEGKVTIGDNVLIAPNSYVNQDVPSDSILIGNPAKIITGRPDATEGYIHNVR